MLYLGIDQHHKQMTISLRDGEGTVIRKRQVSTRPEKTRAFLDDLRAQAGEDGFMTILEVCGFNDWLIKLLEEYGCREGGGRRQKVIDEVFAVAGGRRLHRSVAVGGGLPQSRFSSRWPVDSGTASAAPRNNVALIGTNDSRGVVAQR